jgi:hypothetical protein
MSLSVVCVACCQVEVSASGISFVQRSPIKGGLSARNHEASIMRRPWPISGSCAMKKEKINKLCGYYAIIIFKILLLTSEFCQAN